LALAFIEIPSALAFRSIVSGEVLNLAAISDAVAPFVAIAITSRSSFQVNWPGLRLPAIQPLISDLGERGGPRETLAASSLALAAADVRAADGHAKAVTRKGAELRPRAFEPSCSWLILNVAGCGFC
jgi:hypothetical protein